MIRRGAAVLLAASVAGCGGGSRPQPAPPQATTPAATPSSLPLTGSPSPDPLTPGPERGFLPSPVPLAATEAPVRYGHPRSVPWRFDRVGDGGRRIYLDYTTGGCTTSGYARASETARSVTITVVVQSVERPGAACPAIARLDYGWVQLSEPLGRRTLLHAPTS